MHWGNEYVATPSPDQRAQATAILASPYVDAIVGGHVHVIQPVEQIGGKYVVYGVGNFLSNQSGECCPVSSQDGVIVTLHFKQTAGKWSVGGIGYTPTYVDRAGGYVIYPDAAGVREPEHSVGAQAAAGGVLPAHRHGHVVAAGTERRAGPDTAGPVSPACAAVTDVTLITSADDPRLSDYRSLTDVALRRKIEPENGLFIAEGEKVVRRALAAGYEMRSLLCAASRAPDLADLPGPHLVADYDVLAAVTGFHVHRGVLAAMARRPLATVDEVQRGAQPAHGARGAVEHDQPGGGLPQRRRRSASTASSWRRPAATRSTGGR